MDTISHSKMAFSSSGSAKRALVGVDNAIQAATCLVDGCTADLSNCRKYHQRHKVCEVHSKSPEVLITGQKLRFCQQCSRFHSLEEFDKGKRSCRKRLDGHNRRRRKPRPYLFSASTNHGTNVLQSASPLVHPTMALTNPLSSSAVKAKSRDDNQHPAWGHHPTMALTNPLSSSAVEAKSRDDNQHPAWGHHADYARSLLSSSTSPSQASYTTLSHVMHLTSGSFSTITSPLDPGLNYAGLENDPYSDAGWGGLIEIRGGPHQHDHEDPQTLAFHWQHS